MSKVSDCTILEIPRSLHEGGDVTGIPGGDAIPFSVERVYYLYNVPDGEARGGHAHRDLQQLIIAPIGSFDLVLDDGEERRIVSLDRADKGVLMPRGIWRELTNFSSGGVCLVLASRPYEEGDYIRDYQEFLAYKAVK